MEAIKEAIKRVIQGQDLSAGEAELAMGDIFAGQATPSQIGAFLAALRVKRETPDEILGCARAMRASAVPVLSQRRDLVDTCGTGGDMAGTFNISTIAAFVVAGAGVPVAKHGNRSVSSKCGSADLLEALGVNLTLTPEQLGRCLDEVGIAFLFAPRLHPAMAHAMPVRRELGVRTVFNLLGPLTNPARVPYQAMGVFDPALTEPIALVLSGLGTRRALVFHGHGGLDELSTTGPNRVTELSDGTIHTYELDPARLGLPRASREQLAGADPAANAQLALAVLAGEAGPRRDVVLLNAAAALYIAGAASSISDGLALAAASLDSGAAQHALQGLVHLSQRLAEEAA
jgi:anthranilate phosphoribosyltransferase